MLFFLTTFGEWLETNIVAIIFGIASWALSAVAVIWYVSQAVALSKANGEKLEKLQHSFDEHANDFDQHKSDANVHTTFEFRQHIQSEVTRIKDSIEHGHNRIENKIDRVIERMTER